MIRDKLIILDAEYTIPHRSRDFVFWKSERISETKKKKQEKTGILFWMDSELMKSTLAATDDVLK